MVRVITVVCLRLLERANRLSSFRLGEYMKHMVINDLSKGVLALILVSVSQSVWSYDRMAEALKTSPNTAYIEEASSEVDYQINPQDLLEIKVLQVPDMARNVRVDAKGDVSLPLVGVVRAAGYTSYGLEQEIAKRLAVDLIRNPQVSVFIKEFTSQRVTIQGLVKKPGIYEFPGKASLLEAISMGGGLDDKADYTKVRVVRRMTGQEQSMLFNLDTIEKDAKLNPRLKSGDVVVVPEAQPITVEGAVIKPGIFYARGKSTLLQVISQAGGPTDLASTNDVKVFRGDIDGKKQLTMYDLNKIRQAKIADPEISPGNLVVIEQSTGLTIVRNVSNTLRGFIGLGNVSLLQGNQ